jgi:hypothetical protein
MQWGTQMKTQNLKIHQHMKFQLATFNVGPTPWQVTSLGMKPNKDIQRGKVPQSDRNR